MPQKLHSDNIAQFIYKVNYSLAPSAPILESMPILYIEWHICGFLESAALSIISERWSKDQRLYGDGGRGGGGRGEGGREGGGREGGGEGGRGGGREGGRQKGGWRVMEVRK